MSIEGISDYKRELITYLYGVDREQQIECDVNKCVDIQPFRKLESIIVRLFMVLIVRLVA